MRSRTGPRPRSRSWRSSSSHPWCWIRCQAYSRAPSWPRLTVREFALGPFASLRPPHSASQTIGVPGSKLPPEPVWMSRESLCHARVEAHSGAMTTTTEKTANRAAGAGTEAVVLGGVGEILRGERVSEFVATAVAGARLEDQRVCLVVPDGTRTCPLPLLLQAMREGLASASEVTVVVALGTHQGMSDEHLARHLGYNLGQLEQTARETRELNTELWLTNTFT